MIIESIIMQQEKLTELEKLKEEIQSFYKEFQVREYQAEIKTMLKDFEKSFIKKRHQ